MSWIPIKNIAALDKVKQYLEALGVEHVGDLPEGSERDPGDVQLYVGNIEILAPELPIHDESGDRLSRGTYILYERSVCLPTCLPCPMDVDYNQDGFPILPSSRAPSPIANRFGIDAIAPAADGSAKDQVLSLDTNASTGSTPAIKKAPAIDKVLDAAASAASSLVEAPDLAPSSTPVSKSASKALSDAATEAKSAASAIADTVRKQVAARADVMKQPIPRKSKGAATTPVAKNKNKRPVEPSFFLANAGPRPYASSSSATRRILPEDWEIVGRRLLIPIYAENQFIYTLRVPMGAVADYMRLSDAVTEGGIQGGVGDVPVGYAEFADIVNRADFGKHLAALDVFSGRMDPVPADRRIDRTFWVRQLLDIRGDAAAHREMDNLEGKPREMTDNDIMLKEVTELEAVQGRLANARKQRAFEAARARKKLNM
ncbi:hypothetical protein GGG16DRAFT_120400 [Schizophyllum commune]